MADALAESVTFTVKFVVPAAVGLPASTPAEDSVIPAGSAELALVVHVYPEPEPPLAFRVVDV